MSIASELSSDQKKELSAKRLKRGHKPGAKDSKQKGTSSAAKGNKDVIKNLRAMHRQVSQLAKQMGKAGVNDDDTDSSTHSGSLKDGKEGKDTTTKNRTNSALTRQKRVAEPCK